MNIKYFQQDKNRPTKDNQIKRKNKKIGLLSTKKVDEVKFNRISSYCVAREYNLQDIATSFKDKTFAIYNSVIGIMCIRKKSTDDTNKTMQNFKFVNPYEDGDGLMESLCHIFLFDYGVIVFWNLEESEEKTIIAELKKYEIKSNFKTENDYLQYKQRSDDDVFNPKLYINNDTLFLSGDKFEEKLSVSYAIGQSSKLDYFEEDIDISIGEARVLAEELAKTGRISLDHISLNKKIGKLHLKKNEINLDTDILDIPDYFWNNDKYQAHFNTVSKYLEINKRTEVINHRLNIIAELLFVLNEGVNFRHISKLDWAIIILILINVLILFIWDILIENIILK